MNSTAIMARESAIECFFTPRSVAIVGASSDPRKWGHMAAEQAMRDRGDRTVWLVNSRGGEILGQACQTRIAELPDGLDLAVVTLPPAAFEDAVGELVAKGTRAIVAITAGFGESGAAGRETEARIVKRVRSARAAMVGPNCMGVFDGLAPFRCMPWAEIAPGPVGFISQSGGLIMDLSLRLAECGLGVSRAVSIGNQADVGLAEFVRNLGAHDGTEVLALYGESFVGGRQVFHEIERVVAAGKPVVMLSPDSTHAAARAARSHTASMVTQRRVVEAAARDAGAHYVGNLREMTELLQALVSRQRGAGRRTFVLTDTGGPGVLLAGEVERAGLMMPMPSEPLKARIEAALTQRAVVGNPIDLVDNMTVEPAIAVLQALMDSNECDAVLMNLHAFVHDTPELERAMGSRLAAVARAAGKPVTVSCRSLDIPGVADLTAAGIPVFRDGDAAARMLAVLCTDASLQLRGVPRAVEGPRGSAITEAGYASARAALQEAGIAKARSIAVNDSDAAVSAADDIGYPVVLKAAHLNHKSDEGGVALGIADRDALIVEYKRMSSLWPGAPLRVEEMIRMRDAVELLLGVRRDKQMGPLLVLGLGGIHAEHLDDITLTLAPVRPRDVESALHRLRGAPRLLGARGQPAIDVAAVARVAKALCDLVLRHPEIEDIEVNPLLVSHDHAVALDARITLVGHARSRIGAGVTA